MYSTTEENYLKAIYTLSSGQGAIITTNAIADLISTKAASVTDMVKKLAEKKLVKHEKYKGVALTEKGKRVAIETVRKHRLWEFFLCDKLHFGWDEVHEIAEQLEHINSQLLTDRLDAFLNYPTHDPHGDPIPTKDGEIRNSSFVILANAKLNQTLTMAGVVNHSSVFLQHLNKLNLTLGVTIKVIEKNAFDGSIEIILNNKQLQLSSEVALNILVK